MNQLARRLALVGLVALIVGFAGTGTGFAQATDEKPPDGNQTCGNLLASFPLKGNDAIKIDNKPVEADIEVYERCVKIKLKEPNGTVLADKEVLNNGGAPPGGVLGDPHEVVVADPQPHDPNATITLGTRVYDLEAINLPLKKDAKGAVKDGTNGYIKFIEVEGCDCLYIQVGRLKIEGWDPNGNMLDGLPQQFPPGGGFGIDAPGPGILQGNKQNPFYPQSGAIPGKAGMSECPTSWTSQAFRVASEMRSRVCRSGHGLR